MRTPARLCYRPSVSILVSWRATSPRRSSVLADERSQRFALDLAAGVSVSADRLVLREAVTNIIDNAIKHSPRGSSIQVDVRTDGSHAPLTVTDEGPGVPVEYRDRVFDRFFRIDEGRSRDHGGTGLGLAIASVGGRSQRRPPAASTPDTARRLGLSNRASSEGIRRETHDVMAWQSSSARSRRNGAGRARRVSAGTDNARQAGRLQGERARRSTSRATISASRSRTSRRRRRSDSAAGSR